MPTGDPPPYRATPTGYEPIEHHFQVPLREIQVVNGNNEVVTFTEPTMADVVRGRPLDDRLAAMRDGDVLTVKCDISFGVEDPPPRRSRYDVALGRKRKRFELCPVCGDAIYNPKDPDATSNCGYPLCECGDKRDEMALAQKLIQRRDNDG